MLNLVVDFEATCCVANEFHRSQMEIIEIGAVLFDNNGGVSHYQNCIKPVKNTVLTNFCKELTGITQNDVDVADGFDKVMNHFLSWIRTNTNGEDYKFYSWGDFDKNIMKRQCSEYNINADDVLSRHENAKVTFAKTFRCREMGMAKALKINKMPLIGQHHRALDDAINITQLVKLFLGDSK